MSNYDLVAGDGGSTLRVTIKDNVTEELIDLTGKSIKVRYQIGTGALQQRDMTALNQATSRGQADYRFLTTDLPVGGEMQGEIRLQDGLQDQLTTVDTFHLLIKTPLA